MIGIVGYGFVGKSVHKSIPQGYSVNIYDPKTKFDSFSPILLTDICFICVPTPTKEGQQDATIMMDTIKKLSDGNYSGLIVIKSTILPRIMRDILILYPNMSIIAAPEFLDQATYLNEQTKHIIGVTNMYQAHKYTQLYPNVSIKITDPVTAFMAKYIHNTHGALKVSFFNEIFDTCNRVGVNYREAINCVLFANDNVGAQYTRIAVDGERGFGGACFGKDVIAFNDEYNLKTLDAAIQSNLNLRQKYMEDML